MAQIDGHLQMTGLPLAVVSAAGEDEMILGPSRLSGYKEIRATQLAQDRTQVDASARQMV
jgi:hypothetical protein